MRRIIGLVAISLLIGASGCASTQEAKSVEKSGFLGDYSRLKEGQRGSFMSQGAEGQALLVYQNPAADWRKYKKVWLDPVTVWMNQKDSQLKDVAVEDRQRLAALLWSKLNEQLKQDYVMTSTPGPDVMRIQVAITEAGSSNALYGYAHEHLFAGEIAVDSEEHGHRRGSIRGQCERRNEDNRYCHWNCSRGSSRSPGRYEEYRWVLVLVERRRRIVPFLGRKDPLSLMPISRGHGLRGAEGLKVR